MCASQDGEKQKAQGRVLVIGSQLAKGTEEGGGGDGCQLDKAAEGQSGYSHVGARNDVAL